MITRSSIENLYCWEEAHPTNTEMLAFHKNTKYIFYVQ